jgi:hypothetical protein
VNKADSRYNDGVINASRLAAAAALFAGLAWGQASYSAHSGWGFQDTLETAGDVVVADLVKGGGVDNGSQVTVSATVRVVRVLGGEIAPGTELALEWHYQPAPFEGPAASAKVPALRALWFLRRKSGGGFEPLMASGMMGPFGGFFLELPGPQPSGGLSYAPDAPLEDKIAREVGFALEDLVAAHASDLAPHRPQPPVNGALAPWVQTRTRFDALLMVLDALKKPATAPVYQDFSNSPEADLRLLGLMGRVDSGDLTAIIELEPDLPRLASAYSAIRATTHLTGIDLGKDFGAAHALGRMALSEVTIPGLDGMFAMRVPTTHSVEFLPYLVVMLGSPDASTRGGALAAFCNLLGPAWDPQSKPQALWKPEMAGYCPSGVPMNDRQQEQRDIQFWKQWWEERRDDIRKTVNLPTVAAPPRYNTPQNPPREMTEIPLEVRFQGLVSMSREQATHYHDETGALVPGPPPQHDPVASALNPADREVYQKVMDSVAAKLDENQKHSMDIMNAARLNGTTPSPEQMQALWQERLAVLKAGVQDLQNRLSPAGGQAVEGFLKRSGGGMAAGVPSGPPK